VILRIASWAIAALGLILLVVSLTADLTGLGDDDGFDVGVQQGAGIALGIVLIVVGLVLVRRTHPNGS
jgi:sulfite exporter TauE/SafE